MGGVGFHLTLGQHIMKKFLVIIPALLGLAAADKSGGHVAAATNQVPLSSQGAAVPPYYSEYDYAYEPQTQSFSQRVEKRRKTKKGSSNKSRELDNSISWLDLLEGVNTFVSAIRTKRSASEEPFNADTVSF